MSEQSVSQLIHQVLQHHINQLDGEPPQHLYYLVIPQVEAALLEFALCYAKGNQSKAANYLGISRNTLRKKLSGLPV
jgi:Fis family transcriptional regulator